ARGSRGGDQRGPRAGSAHQSRRVRLATPRDARAVAGHPRAAGLPARPGALARAVVDPRPGGAGHGRAARAAGSGRGHRYRRGAAAQDRGRPGAGPRRRCGAGPVAGETLGVFMFKPRLGPAIVSAMRAAFRDATERGLGLVTNEHLLVCLLEDRNTQATLITLGVDLARLRGALETLD